MSSSGARPPRREAPPLPVIDLGRLLGVPRPPPGLSASERRTYFREAVDRQNAESEGREEAAHQDDDDHEDSGESNEEAAAVEQANNADRSGAEESEESNGSSSESRKRPAEGNPDAGEENTKRPANEPDINVDGSHGSASLPHSLSAAQMEATRERLKKEFEEEKAQILEELPEEYKNCWGQVGYAKWGKGWEPCLVVSPFAVPASSEVREQWMTMYENTAYRRRQMRHLVFLYGQEDRDNAFRFIPKNKIVLYEEGVKNGYDKLPARIQKKIDSGEKLTKAEKELVKAHEALNADRLKQPEDRRKFDWMMEMYESDDDVRAILTGEDLNDDDELLSRSNNADWRGRALLKAAEQRHAVEETTCMDGSGLEDSAESNEEAAVAEHESEDRSGGAEESEGNNGPSAESRKRPAERNPDADKENTKRPAKEPETNNGPGSHGSASLPHSLSAAQMEATRERLQKELEEEKTQILEELPEEYKNCWGQVGYAKWGRCWIPCLVVSPFAVPASSEVREQWMTMYENTANQRHQMSQLVFLYGQEDRDNAFWFIAKNRIALYKEGLKKGYDKLPVRIQRKIDSGEKLTKQEKELIKAHEELEADLLKQPEDRRRVFEHMW